MRRFLFLFLFLFPFLSFSQSFSGKYKLKYLSYKNDTVDLLDTSAVKAITVVFAKVQKPEMTSLDSAGIVELYLANIDFHQMVFLNFKSNGEFWLGRSLDDGGYKDGKYKVTGELIIVKNSRGEKHEYTMEVKGAHQFITITGDGFSFIYEKQ